MPKNVVEKNKKKVRKMFNYITKDAMGVALSKLADDTIEEDRKRRAYLEESSDHGQYCFMKVLDDDDLDRLVDWMDAEDEDTGAAEPEDTAERKRNGKNKVNSK